MNELRFVRREERSLILANESDEEFRLVIDDLLIAELKHASRKERVGGGKVRPREIQSLVRAGKSRAEIANLTGLDEASIERYEEPVLAERRYILERAHAVEVRTEASDEAEQKFGAVIAERLLALDAEASEWAAWRDEDAGWLIGLEFISRDVAHRAVWSFDHRKQTLAPTNPDAVSLSKQGNVGDRLIPKLRAVDSGERTSQFAVVAEPAQETPASNGQPQGKLAAPQGAPEVAAPVVPTAPQSAPGPANSAPAAAATPEPVSPALDVNAEYARRREIDQRAIKSDDSGPVDFSQTADLLDALRRRRGERQLAEEQSPDDTVTTPVPTQKPVATPPVVTPPAATPPAPVVEPEAHVRGLKKPRSIWGGAGVASGVTAASQRDAGSGQGQAPSTPAPAPEASQATPVSVAPVAPIAPVPDAPAATPSAGGASGSTADPRSSKKGRASIPSWDDILFGTRSDEDPAG